MSRTILPANSVAAQLAEAEAKAIDSLARYKFMMFGYWAAVWVHLSRLDGQRRVNPFARLVVQARIMRGDRPSEWREIGPLPEVPE